MKYLQFSNFSNFSHLQLFYLECTIVSSLVCWFLLTPSKLDAPVPGEGHDAMMKDMQESHLTGLLPQTEDKLKTQNDNVLRLCKTSLCKCTGDM